MWWCFRGGGWRRDRGKRTKRTKRTDKPTMRDFEDIKQDVLHRLDMRQVAEICGLVIRREGVAFKASCPFHVEKSASFVIGGKKGMEHRYHCFGCGCDGDIFTFWQELKGCDFKQALTDLAGIAAVPMGDGVEWARPTAPRVRQAERRPASDRPEYVKPSLPPLRCLRREECALVAERRGLDAEAVWVAAREYKRMAFSMWPLYEAHGEWHERSVGVWPSWCAIDATRNVAEFRRLDDGKYPRQDGGEIKSWSTCGKAWPVGAAHLDGRPAVMLVEGGPDMLAAYHFLRRHGMLGRVAVVCMLGASNRMREDALPFFAGKRVRIMVDADPLKDDPDAKKRKVPGIEAAARWGQQLNAAGAVVETFCVGPVYERQSLRGWSRGEVPAAEVVVEVPGLLMPDGKAVKDLNDLAKCGPEVLRDENVVQAFRHWDF